MLNSAAKVAIGGAGAVLGFAVGGPVGLLLSLGAGYFLGVALPAPQLANVLGSPPAPTPAPMLTDGSQMAPSAPPVVVVTPPAAVSTFAPPAASAPGPPPGADVPSATVAVNFMLIGHDAEKIPAGGYLKKFQASVGLPATGTMDPTTRTLLLQTIPAAARLPAKTILG